MLLLLRWGLRCRSPLAMWGMASSRCCRRRQPQKQQHKKKKNKLLDPAAPVSCCGGGFAAARRWPCGGGEPSPLLPDQHNHQHNLYIFFEILYHLLYIFIEKLYYVHILKLIQPVHRGFSRRRWDGFQPLLPKATAAKTTAQEKK